ncbi:MAG: Fe-S cluster assembly protein SufD [Rhodospirillales bacterium]|nr:Fe-S cluster assembly protein SufD [Alphaproteobacteria bacterium]MBL6948589.1 Fe-S cluster assembly protein SufD [Rhodospirillales bacterium]
MTKTTSPLAFVDSFDDERTGLPGIDLPWLKTLRRDGIERFKGLGMPTPKLEAWKYTRLKPLEDTSFQPVTDEDGMAALDHVPSLLPDPGGRPRLVFVNGRMRPNFWIEGDLPDGVHLDCLRDVLLRAPDWAESYIGSLTGEDAAALVQLNTAMMDTGFALRVDPGVIVETPIEVVYIGGLTDRPVAYFPRNLIVLGEGAQATVVKHHVGMGVGAYFANAVTEIDIAQGARLNHYEVQAESRDATHLGAVNVRVAKDATYDSFTLSIGGRLSRNEVSVRLEGQGAHAGVNGAYLMRGSEHCDNTTRIEHLAPNTSCREIFKGVLDDQSRAVFQGRIVVNREAQGTDGHQLCKTLLLSTGAEIDAKPELEIYADDVKCSHGATTGQIDETALFYLRSRGIPEALARNLLVQSFLGEALEEIADENIREAFTNKVLHWLPAACFLSEEWRDA